ncbi:MAG TPA: response regulator [Vicinamibacterales bacterium]|nr:response regulator [Vicinamibacterales bacterium]
MPPLVLIVVADAGERHQLDLLLSHAGYRVVTADSFENGRLRLASTSPDLVVAAVRLGAFNGLHLAVLIHQTRPGLPVIITHDASDAVLTRDAIQQDATFVVNPIRNPEFMTLIGRAIGPPPAAQRPIERWPRKPATSGAIGAQLAGGIGRIVDVSYDGLRVAFAREQDVPEAVDVTLLSAGVTVKARIVWAARSESDEVWCGAEIVVAGEGEASGWRDFVDHMP